MDLDEIYDDENDGVGTPPDPSNENEGPETNTEGTPPNPSEDPDEGDGGEDENGNPEGTEYDDDGNPTNLDDDGNVVEGEPEKDESGNPIGTEYDEEGNPTNLNEDGTLKESSVETGSAINQFFEKKFGVKGGEIPFQDGSKMKVEDMTPEQQYEALEFYTNHLLEEASGKVSNEERAILKSIRESGKSFNDLVAEEANNRMLKKESEAQLGKPVNYDEVSDEEIYKKFIKNTKPDISNEELEEILKTGKDHPAYDGTVKHYREHLKQDQDEKITKWEQEQREAAEKELNEDKATIIDTAKNMDNIAGWPVNDDIKNELLADLVEVDAEGNSPFMKEVFGDPSKMLQAAWYMKYGETYYNELNNYWQKKLKEVETSKNPTKPGKNKMAKPGSKPSPGKSANKTNQRKKSGEKKQFKTIDDIHEN